MEKTKKVAAKRSMKSAELGRWGESRFASLCSDVRLVPQRPDYDLNGWDFLIEFPHEPAEADTDLVSRPPPLQCFVQVKTFWENGREVDLRLSAAARLGKSPLPSFVCILEATGELAISGMHLLHMEGPLLESVLRKLREMQARGRSTSINKAAFRIPVPRRSDRLPPTGAELLRAMQSAIGPDHADYGRRKAAHLRDAGFPSRPVTASFTVKAESQRDYSDFMLGTKSLPVVAFEAMEMRWDIGIPVTFEDLPVSARLIPKPMDVELTWKRPGESRRVRLPMRALLAPSAAGEDQEDRWLLTHPNLVIEMEGASLRLTMKGPDVMPTSYRTLKQLHAVERILGANGPLEMQLVHNGRLVVGWHLDMPVALRPAEVTDALGNVLADLGAVLYEAGLQDAQLRMGTWSTWLEKVRFLAAMVRGEAGLTASQGVQPWDGQSPDSTERETLHVSAIDFGDEFLAYYATCRGKLEADDDHGRWRFVVRDFSLRELRSVERTDDAMHAFVKEAEAVTALTTKLIMWEALPESYEPADR